MREQVIHDLVIYNSSIGSVRATVDVYGVHVTQMEGGVLIMSSDRPALLRMAYRLADSGDTCELDDMLVHPPASYTARLSGSGGTVSVTARSRAEALERAERGATYFRVLGVARAAQ